MDWSRTTTTYSRRLARWPSFAKPTCRSLSFSLEGTTRFDQPAFYSCTSNTSRGRQRPIDPRCGVLPRTTSPAMTRWITSNASRRGRVGTANPSIENRVSPQPSWLVIRSPSSDLDSRRPAPGRRRNTITSQGHPRTAFRRALELTALVALRDRERGRRYAIRWLKRWLTERDAATIEDAAWLAGCLAALGGNSHDAALAALRAASTGLS